MYSKYFFKWKTVFWVLMVLCGFCADVFLSISHHQRLPDHVAPWATRQSRLSYVVVMMVLSFILVSSPQLLKASEFKWIKRMPPSFRELSFDAAESTLQCLPAARWGAHQSHSFKPSQSPSAASWKFPPLFTSSESSFLKMWSCMNICLCTNPSLFVINVR